MDETADLTIDQSNDVTMKNNEQTETNQQQQQANRNKPTTTTSNKQQAIAPISVTNSILYQQAKISLVVVLLSQE
jgi:hypothetical protein